MTYHQELIEIYHNVYKSVTGVRPRHINFDAMSTLQIQDDLEWLCHESEHVCDVEMSSWSDNDPKNAFAVQLADYPA